MLLFSGGVDSTALAWRERPALCLTIDYGQQPAVGEIRAAADIAKRLDLCHEVVQVDCGGFGSGDLAGRPPHALAASREWWPFRNQLLLTIAAMAAIHRGASTILIGTVRTDGFLGDGTEKFLRSFNGLLASQEGSLRVEAPAQALSSAEFVRKTGLPRELLALSHSCHIAEWACGSCEGCFKALELREELGYEPV